MTLLGVLRRVLLEKSEEDISLVLVEGSRELGNGGRDLDSGKKDAFLSLKGDVFGPLDEPGEVASGLDAVSDAEIARSLLEERVDLLLDLLSALFSLSSFSLYQHICTILFVGNNKY